MFNTLDLWVIIVSYFNNILNEIAELSSIKWLREQILSYSDSL